MTRAGSPRLKSRTLHFLQIAGLALGALGAALLVAPQVLGTSHDMKELASSLETAGWLALAASLLLIVVPSVLLGGDSRLQTPADAVVSTPSLSDTVPPLQSLEAPDSQRSEPTFAKRARAPRATQWGPEVFAAIEWRRFEAVCELLFEQAGFETRMQPRSADGGAEIWLNSRNAEGPVAVVQCKHWLGKNVGVTELRDFLAVMTSSELKRGTYATTGTFTPSALRFAKDHSINVLDGHNLLNLIYRRTPLQQKALLEAAYEGEYWRPTCARCGIKLVERTPSRGGGMFWGCTNFPTCRTKLRMA